MAYYQQNMLSIKSRAILANILAEVVLLSHSIETFRECLARIDFFDCIALFRYLDREEKGYLRQKDFQRAIGTTHRKLLTYAFSWFDTMKVGEISRLQFAAFLLPKDNLQLRQLVAKRVENPTSQQLQQETILLQYNIFSKLLVEIMNRELRIIQLRRQLIKSQDYSIRGVLQAMDVHRHQWVSGEDIADFLKNYGFDVGRRQIEKLVEAINCSFDGKITEDQLKWLIEGFENKNKQYLTKIKDSNKKQVSKPSSQKKEVLQTASPFTNEFTIMENTISSDSKTRFKQLAEVLRVAEQQQKQIDELLQLEEKQVTESIDRECERFMAQFRANQLRQYEMRQLTIARQAELRRVEQLRRIHEERAASIRVQQLWEEQALESMRRSRQSQCLQQINLRTAYLKSCYEKQPENTFKRSPPLKERESISPLRKKDYTNLTNLSRLTQVESYRKPSQRSVYQPFPQDAYLNQANHLRDLIKKQRQVERQIQSKFSNGRYDSHRYSRGESIHKLQVPVDKPYRTGFQSTVARRNEESPSKAFQSTQANKFGSSSRRDFS